MRMPSPFIAWSLSCVLAGVALANAALIAIRPLLAADAVLAPTGGAGCPAAVVDYTFLTYDGPVGITGACVAWFQYTGGRMTLVAYDVVQDGLFRSGFDPAFSEAAP